MWVGRIALNSYLKAQVGDPKLINIQRTTRCCSLVVLVPNNLSPVDTTTTTHCLSPEILRCSWLWQGEWWATHRVPQVHNDQQIEA